MSLNDEIENLKQMVLKMSDSVVVNINDAIKYYNDELEINEINDDLIDQYERLIEEICVNLLLRERPYARDLKEVTGILKLVSDIERIGDHAEDIYDFSKRLKNVEGTYKAYGVIELAKYVINMINEAIKSFITKNVDLANKVINDDDYVDRKYIEIIESLTNKENADSDYLSFALYTTLVVKYLERIADHSVNIAEWAIYISSGYYKDKMIL